MILEISIFQSKWRERFTFLTECPLVVEIHASVIASWPLPFQHQRLQAGYAYTCSADEPVCP